MAADDWQFFVVAENGEGYVAHRWAWRVSEGEELAACAEQGFTTLAECQADALKHGFTSGDEVIIDSQGVARHTRIGERRSATRRRSPTAGPDKPADN